MVLCNLCGAKNKNDALHCAQCGARLETKQCRQCGTILGKNERFCNKCGYPTSGKPCPKCGKVVPDEASFCADCGYSFADEKPPRKRAATAKSAGGAKADVSEKSAASAKSGTATKKSTTTAKSGGATTKSGGTTAKSGTTARKRTVAAKTDAAKAESASTVAETASVAPQEQAPAKKPTTRKKPAPKAAQEQKAAADEKPAEEIKPVVAEEKPAEEAKVATVEEKPAEQPKAVVAEEKPAEETKPAVADEKPTEEIKVAVADEKPAEQPKAAPQEKPAEKPKEASRTYWLWRAIAVPVVLLAMFVTSFFGLFKAEVELSSIDCSVTGFEAVRGLYYLIDTPTEAEMQKDLAAFVQEGDYDDLQKAIQDFGVLRVSITKENRTPDLVGQVVLWGVSSLAVMATALTFFVLSLVHAILVARNKRTGTYKHESLAFALLAALAFSFLLTGGTLAIGSIALLILGGVSLAGIAVCKYTIEKQPRPALGVQLRRAVCGVLVILTAVFAATDVLTVSYKDSDVKTGIPIEELYGGMADVFENGNGDVNKWLIDAEGNKLLAVDIDAVLREYLTTDGSQDSPEDRKFKQFLLRYMLSPMVLCYAEEANADYAAPMKAASWLLFAANVLFAAAVVAALCRIMQSIADLAEKDKSMLYTGLVALGIAAVFGASVPFAVMGNSIAEDLVLGARFGWNVLLIVAAALGVVGFVIASVWRSLLSKKDKGLTLSAAQAKA